MDFFSNVQDLGPMENVRVVHRRLKIPRDEFYRQLITYDPDEFEIPAQMFVKDYIEWKGEDPGVVGMIRGWEEDEFVLLDATLRYPQDPQAL